MKETIATLLAVVLIHSSILSQTSFPGGISFSEQEQIDNFNTNYPGITDIDGDVIICGHLIDDLRGLKQLSSIEGDLIIGSASTMVNFIRDLSGLNNLVYIGGDLKIMNNCPLSSISGLDNLAKINGDLLIDNNLSLVTLSPLRNLKFVGGDVTISRDISLHNLRGLEGLTKFTGNLVIRENENLRSFQGLENLVSVEGNLMIISNPDISSLNGLEGLTDIMDTLRIDGNAALVNLSGLNGLRTVQGGIFIGGRQDGNPSLVSLQGLEGLALVKGMLRIEDNNSLVSLEAIANLNLKTLSGLYIWKNKRLATCGVKSICDYLADPSGFVEIYSNAEGCDNPGKVAHSAGFNIPCLPYGPYYFLRQKDIDDFTTDYPGCTDLSGDVMISGKDIVDLNGLGTLNSIMGNLVIFENDQLVSLRGLENLEYISKGLYIGSNKNLESLDGLDSLSGVGEFLEMDFNERLKNLSGFKTLTRIGKGIHIEGNRQLTSLEGLEKIGYYSLDYFIISNNFHLSECNIRGICDYLVSADGKLVLFNNDHGCNNLEEVSASCNYSEPEVIQLTDQCSYSTDNSTGEVTFSFSLEEPMDVDLVIYDLRGNMVSKIVDGLMQPGTHTVTWDDRRSTQGVYYFSLTAGRRSTTGKLIVSR